MARFRPLILVLLMLLPLVGAQAQNIPPQIAFALANLSSRLGHPITLNTLDSWTYEQNLYTDTALGCPYVAGTPRPEGISGITFVLVYQGTSYDYRVSADGSVFFPCIPDGGGGQAQPPQQQQPAAQPTNCPSSFLGYLPPRLSVGGQARIGAGGTPNRMRDQPSTNGNQIGLIQPNETVSVLEGPNCEETSHIIWWRVDDRGVQGWTAEGLMPDNYFLAPLGSSLPSERDLITPANVGTLVPLTTISLAGVSSVSFGKDETLIALGGLSGLEVYDMATLTQNVQLSDISQPVTAVAFSSDGRYLAYGKQDGTLIVIDVIGNTHTTVAQLSTSGVSSLAFSPDQRYLLASGSGSLAQTPGAATGWQIFDLPHQKQMSALPTAFWVRAVSFSLDGNLFAWLDASLHVVSLTGGGNARTFALTAPPNGGLAWRPSATGTQPSHSVAFVDGTTIRLDNLDSNVEQTFVGDPNFVASVLAFSPDGSLLAAMDVPNNTATGSTVNIFDADTSDLITSTPLEASNTLVFSPDGTLLVVASNGEVVLLGVNSSTQTAVG